MAPREDQLTASYETALCFIPPQDQWHAIDSLRCSNDKGYCKWPPHVNVLYPFVSRDCIQQTIARILPILQEQRNTFASSGIPLSLDSPGSFTRKQGATLFIHDEDPTRIQRLDTLRNLVLKGLKWRSDDTFQMHMTVAQCEEADSDKRQLLLEKVKLLPSVSWEAYQLTVLVRNESTGCMKVHGQIDIASGLFHQQYLALSLYNALPPIEASCIEPRRSYHFNITRDCWSSHQIPSTPDACIPEHLVVASYNVLAEFQWPPRQDRYPIIVHNVLAKTARADVVILQEVTDDFLPYLLNNEGIREIYPFTTHALPDGLSIGPLPSLLNVVVLSRQSFTWEFLPFQRRHKGCSILTFDHIGTRDDQGHSLPLILAATHLSQGLSDGAVATKRGELQRILNHMGGLYPKNIWILAGYLNMATSSYSLNSALEAGSISKQTRTSLDHMEMMLREAGLVDSWVAARIEAGESSDDAKRAKSLSDVFEGEQGATFDPRENARAAAMVGSGFNNRPQRYDRIFLKGLDILSVGGFNMFGFVTDHAETGDTLGSVYPAGDHWGIRCLLRKRHQQSTPSTRAFPPRHAVIPVLPLQAPACLSNVDTLQKCLYSRRCLPTAEDEKIRSSTFELLRSVILGDQTIGSDMSAGRFPSVFVPVGSYGLGVWTLDSDLDCFCVGACSPSTFFRLARQRIVKSASQGIRLLRKVKSKSGTMLILEVQGVKADLHYCQAPHIAEKWPDVMKRPPSDPAFDLKFESLLKLKPARDLFYLRRSIPDLAQFRIAYQLVKEWRRHEASMAQGSAT